MAGTTFQREFGPATVSPASIAAIATGLPSTTSKWLGSLPGEVAQGLASYLVASVTAYGADPTGAVSSVAAFQQALTNHTRVFVPCEEPCRQHLHTLSCDWCCSDGPAIYPTHQSG
jgi:hypothetical protein